MTAVGRRLDSLAADLGRLRRRLEPGSYAADLAERIAGHVDSLDAMLAPTAAELVKAGVSVEDALEAVDGRSHALRRMLGEVRP